MIRLTKPRAAVPLAALLASTALAPLAALLPGAALAQDATWLTNPGTGDFNTAANWNPAAVPTGTAFFGTSTTTSLSFSANIITVIGGWTFNPGASAYTFSTSNNTVNFNGTGIVINGGSASIANNGGLAFQNTSTAGSASITNNGLAEFFNTSTAGSASIANTNNGVVVFADTSTAGSASIANTNNGDVRFFNSSTAGSASITNNNGLVRFFDTSTAGSATFTNSNNGLVEFIGTSTAGNASITNNPTGVVQFLDASTAGSASIISNGGFEFFGASTAGSANITNNSTGGLQFSDSSTAGGATITNNSGLLLFRDTSTAGSATINNNFGALLFRNASTAGSATITNSGNVVFFDTSTAGSATITNNNNLTFFNSSSAGSASITINATGGVQFFGSSTAACASITNNNNLTFFNSSSAGSASITINATGGVQFFGSSTAASASITNNGGLIFQNSSTAGSATIITNSGGRTRFTDSASGGSARFVLNGTGQLDISTLSAAGTMAGSIEGNGFVFLGAKNLAVGGNNRSTNFAGIIADGGLAGGTGGSLTKTGAGTLTLSGINTYTGATVVDAGILSVNGSTAASSLITVNAGGTLGGNGIVGNTVINGGALAPGNSIGLLTVQGSLAFTTASSYMVEVSPANADRVNVTGTAALGGATVNVTFAPGSYMARRYTILNAAGGLSGTFGSAVSSNVPVNFQTTLSYDANNAYLNLTAALGALQGLSINQQNVANSINGFFNGGGTLPPGFVHLFGLTGGNLSTALTQASGETATGTQQTTFDAMNLFMGLLTDPFVAGRGDGVSASSGAPAQFAETNDGASAYAAIYRKAPGAAMAFPHRAARRHNSPRRMMAPAPMPRSIARRRSRRPSRSRSAGACGRRVLADRKPPTATRRWDRTLRPAASQGAQSASTTGSRRSRWQALRWPAAAPTFPLRAASAAAAPTCSRPAPSFVTPRVRPMSRRRWPMAGRTSPPTAPSPLPASISCARSIAPMPGPDASKVATASPRRGSAALASRLTRRDNSPPSICRPMPSRRWSAPTPLRWPMAPGASPHRAASSGFGRTDPSRWPTASSRCAAALHGRTISTPIATSPPPSRRCRARPSSSTAPRRPMTPLLSPPPRSRNG